MDCAAYLVQGLDAARFWPDENNVDIVIQRVSQLEVSLKLLERQVAELRQASLSQSLTTQPVNTNVGSNIVISSSMSPHSSSHESFIELDKVDNLRVSDLTNTKPSLLRLPDKTIIRVKNWNEVLSHCCEFALANNPNISIPLKDATNGNNLLDIVEPVQGIPVEYNRRTIYINVKYGSKYIVKNALYILLRAPASLQKVKPAVVYSKK